MKASPENIRSMNNEISETCVKIINQAKKTVPETEIFNNYNIKDGLKII